MSSTVIVVIGVGVVVLAVVMMKSRTVVKTAPTIINQPAAQSTTQTAITTGGALIGALLNNWSDITG